MQLLRSADYAKNHGGTLGTYRVIADVQKLQVIALSHFANLGEKKERAGRGKRDRVNAAEKIEEYQASNCAIRRDVTVCCHDTAAWTRGFRKSLAVFFDFAKFPKVKRNLVSFDPGKGNCIIYMLWGSFFNSRGARGGRDWQQ